MVPHLIRLPVSFVNRVLKAGGNHNTHYTHYTHYTCYSPGSKNMSAFHHDRLLAPQSVGARVEEGGWEGLYGRPCWGLCGPCWGHCGSLSPIP